MVAFDKITGTRKVALGRRPCLGGRKARVPTHSGGRLNPETKSDFRTSPVGSSDLCCRSLALICRRSCVNGIACSSRTTLAGLRQLRFSLLRVLEIAEDQHGYGSERTALGSRPAMND